MIGRPDLVGDPRFGSAYYPPDTKRALFDELSLASRKRGTADWMQRLREADVRCAPVRDYLEVLGDEGVYENGYLQRVVDPERGEVTTVGCPIRMSDTPARPGAFAPELGEHTEEVLLELGLDWDEIARLRGLGAI